MIDFRGVEKIYLYPGATDFRKGINGLGSLVGNNLEPGCMYVFCNARLKDIKILFVERNSISIFHRRILKNKYSFPKEGERTLVTIEEIKSVIKSADFVNRIERKKYDKINVF